MQADFAEVGTADFSEICLLVSVAGEARAKCILAMRAFPFFWDLSSLYNPSYRPADTGRFSI